MPSFCRIGINHQDADHGCRQAVNIWQLSTFFDLYSFYQYGEKVLSACHDLDGRIVRLKVLNLSELLSFNDFLNISVGNTAPGMKRRPTVFYQVLNLNLMQILLTMQMAGGHSETRIMMTT